MRQTVPRQAILEALRDAEALVTAEDLFVAVHERYPAIGIATVYRTLQLLVDLRIAARVETGDGKARYQLSYPDEPVRHLIASCRRCGRSYPLSTGKGPTTDAIAGLESTVCEAHGFSVEQSMIQLVGVCKSCAEGA